MTMDNKIVIDLTTSTNDELLSPNGEIDLDKVADNWNRIRRSIISISSPAVVTPALMSIVTAINEQNLDYLESQISVIQQLTKDMANSISSVPSVNQYLIDSIASFYSSLDFSPHEAFIQSMKATVIEMNKAHTSLIKDVNLDIISSYYEERKKHNEYISKEYIQELVFEIIGNIKEFANIGDFINQALKKIEALNESKFVKTLSTFQLLNQVKRIVSGMLGAIITLIMSTSTDSQEDVIQIESIQAEFEEFISIGSADSLIDGQAKIVSHEMLVRDGDKKKNQE